jgi:TolB-like protein/Flp pilus assembly protein TadD
MAEDQDATVRTVTAYREEVELLVRQHRGQLVDFTGDNFLAEFASALYAVRCAVEIQSVLRARNTPLAADRRVEFRMGVHLADVQVEGERRGLCISAPVLEHVRGNLELEFDDLGTQSVKNIPDPVRVYRVKLEAVPPKAAPGSMRRAALVAGVAVLLGVVAVAGWRMFAGDGEAVTGAAISAPIRSIAVLPLENLSGDPEQEYFADGMTEALIGDLAKIGSLSVISRTSVMRYKQSDKSLPEIAQELNVEGILEGTVMRAGDRVRITAQLIDSRTDRHLWSDRYDRDLRNILALHSDVARAIAEQVRVELNPEESAALTASRSVDPEAYDAYLRGLQLRGSEGLIAIWGPQAIEQFERAVELDPDFAESWAALAEIRVFLAVGWFDLRRSEYPKAREAAQTALEIDERLGAAHAVLGHVRILYDWDFPGALRAYERAVQLSPSEPIALNGYAYYLLQVGRIDEALEVMERLLSVAPLDLFYRQLRPRNFVWARQYERALKEAERLREENPDFVQLDFGTAYSMLGRLEEAHREFVAFDARCGAPCDWSREARERGWAEGGWEGAQRAWLRAATQREGYSPVIIAFNYATIGETDEAFAWLERGYRERDPLMVGLKASPAFDPLRSDPRFQDLIRRMNYPEAF